MMVSSKGRYAIHVMTYIALNEKEGYVSVSDIAVGQNLSVKYLENIISVLNKGGMLQSLRGKNGGYRLARAPKDYTISEILKLTEGSLAPIECVKDTHEPCSNSAGCLALPLWIGLENAIDGFLSGITLDDVINNNIKL